MTGPDDDTVIAVYQRYGSVWAKLRDEHLVERSWLDRFCDVLPVGGTVLDIGCGSGIPIARELIRRGVNVTGVRRLLDDARAVRAQCASHARASRGHA